MKTPTLQAILRANIVALIVLAGTTIFFAWAMHAWPERWPVASYTPEDIERYASTPNVEAVRAILRSCIEGKAIDGASQRMLYSVGLKFAALASFFAALLFSANVSMLRQLQKDNAKEAL